MASCKMPNLWEQILLLKTGKIIYYVNMPQTRVTGSFGCLASPLIIESPQLEPCRAASSDGKSTTSPARQHPSRGAERYQCPWWNPKSAAKAKLLVASVRVEGQVLTAIHFSRGLSASWLFCVHSLQAKTLIQCNPISTETGTPTTGRLGDLTGWWNVWK